MEPRLATGGGSPYYRRRMSPAAVAAGAVFSLLLHAGLVAVIIFGTMRSEGKIKDEIEPKMLEFEDVQLLALGEEKPPNQLPRIPNPEPAVRPPDEINIAEPKEPVVELEKKEEKKEKEDVDARKRKMLDALSALHNPNRPTNEDTPAGSEDGVLGGDISDAALANLMGTYASKLVGELSRYWELPSTIPPEEIQKLSGQVKVYVRLAETGHVVNYQFVSKSDNEQFNASIERVMRRFQVAGGGRTLPLPEDEQIRRAVLTQGLNLKGWEYTGR